MSSPPPGGAGADGSHGFQEKERTAMKQGKALITFVMVLLAAALTCYLGYYVWDTFQEPFTTTYAYEYELNDSVEAEGLIVRREPGCSRRSGDPGCDPGRGEHVGLSQQIGLVYRDDQAQQAQGSRRPCGWSWSSSGTPSARAETPPQRPEWMRDPPGPGGAARSAGPERLQQPGGPGAGGEEQCAAPGVRLWRGSERGRPGPPASPR